MKNKLIITAILTLAVVAASGMEAQARERKSSGSYQGRKTKGTFQKKVNREKGHVKKETTWQNERGEGKHEAERAWDKKTKSGTYSSNTTTAGGKKFLREGKVTKTGDGTYTQQGTITGPKGKTSTVDRTSTKNDDGSRTVDTTYTGPEGNTLNAEKKITYQDGVRNVEGSYSSSTGKSGTFGSKSKIEDGKIITERSLTNQDGKTWSQEVELDRDGNTITRDVTNTNPWGGSQSFNQSITVEEFEIIPEETTTP